MGELVPTGRDELQVRSGIGLLRFGAREVPARSGLGRVYVFSVAQTFLSDIPVCRIAGLSACFDSAFALTKGILVKVCRQECRRHGMSALQTFLTLSSYGRVCIAKGFAPSAAIRDVPRSGSASHHFYRAHYRAFGRLDTPTFTGMLSRSVSEVFRRGSLGHNFTGLKTN
jgi:hypothetical protein